MTLPESTEKLRVLHLEDSIADHRLACLTLQRSDMRVCLHHVDSLADFVQVLKSHPIDLVLADYQLAGFTAIDAWEFACSLENPPPFVLLSGAIGEIAAVNAIRLGIADYVLKDHIVRLPHVMARAVEVHEARMQRERSAQALAASEQRLALLTAHLQDSIEQERAAISREIHDDIGGALTAVRFDLAWIDRHASDPETSRHAQAANAMLQHALSASQRIMKNLRPPVLDQGLFAAVDWMARDFEMRTGIVVKLTGTTRLRTLSSHIETAAYRTAQEALTNVSKHAHARRVNIEISDVGGTLTLEVSDDGVGMDLEAQRKQESFGLAGLHERAKTVGGWLDISCSAEQGTSVILTVPLEEENDAEETP